MTALQINVDLVFKIDVHKMTACRLTLILVLVKAYYA